MAPSPPTTANSIGERLISSKAAWWLSCSALTASIVPSRRRRVTREFVALMAARVLVRCGHISLGHAFAELSNVNHGRARRLRAERGLSQRQLAGPGVTAAYISRIEAGERVPSVRALRLLAPTLGVSVTYLETGRDTTDSEERDIRIGDIELRLRLGEL